VTSRHGSPSGCLRRHSRPPGDTVLEGEVEHTYHLLTDDEVSSGDRRRAERRLERQGIDIDTLRSDFVSYQAIRMYLKRGAEQVGRRRESA
jgi:hypothetical protein